MMTNDEIGVSIIHVFFEYPDDLITDSSNRSQQFPAFLIIVLVKTEVVNRLSWDGRRISDFNTVIVRRTSIKEITGPLFPRFSNSKLISAWSFIESYNRWSGQSISNTFSLRSLKMLEVSCTFNFFNIIYLNKI